MSETNPAAESNPSAETSDPHVPERQPVATPPAKQPVLSLESLQAELYSLRSLLILGLLGTLIFSFALNFHLLWQLRARSHELRAQQPSIDRALTGYESKSRPMIEKFLLELKDFTNTHSDFAPILDRHMPETSPSTSTLEKLAETAEE